MNLTKNSLNLAIILLSFTAISNLNASAPTTSKKIIAKAIITNFQTDYSIQLLAEGYTFKVKDGHQVDPKTNLPLVMPKYSHQQKHTDPNCAKAHALFFGVVQVAAINAKKLAVQSTWNVFEDRTAGQAS